MGEEDAAVKGGTQHFAAGALRDGLASGHWLKAAPRAQQRVARRLAQQHAAQPRDLSGKGRRRGRVHHAKVRQRAEDGAVRDADGRRVGVQAALERDGKAPAAAHVFVGADAFVVWRLAACTRGGVIHLQPALHHARRAQRAGQRHLLRLARKRLAAAGVVARASHGKRRSGGVKRVQVQQRFVLRQEGRELADDALLVAAWLRRGHKAPVQVALPLARATGKRQRVGHGQHRQAPAREGEASGVQFSDERRAGVRAAYLVAMHRAHDKQRRPRRQRAPGAPVQHVGIAGGARQHGRQGRGEGGSRRHGKTPLAGRAGKLIFFAKARRAHLMKIIVLGAGRVGERIAENLVSEDNDLTIIDPDAARLRALQDRFDLRGVAGNGVLPSVLRSAGAADCDLFIACAALDETNLAACKVARSVFNVPSTIAQLRAPELVQGGALLGKEGFGVDRVVCPEASVTHYIQHLIDYPEALQVLRFSQGKAHLVTVRVAGDSQLARQSLGEFRAQHAELPIRIVAQYRGDRYIPCDGDSRFAPGDEVLLIAARENVRAALHAIGNPDRPVRRVMIAGGSRVALSLARGLIGRCAVKIIEPERVRCEYLASELPPEMLVLEGSGADEELLTSENVGEVDLFVALGDNDENNILAALLAKRLGARRVIALVERRAYADMMQGSAIDIAISPAHAVIGELLMHVRRGVVAAVHSLRRGAAEALEGIATGDEHTSQLAGRRVDELKLPVEARVGAIVRGKGETAKVIIAQHDTRIESDDHVIIFLPHKRMVRQVEKLFQVRPTFF